jgi:hypothetical protein
MRTLNCINCRQTANGRAILEAILESGSDEKSQQKLRNDLLQIIQWR